MLLLTGCSGGQSVLKAESCDSEAEFFWEKNKKSGDLSAPPDGKCARNKKCIRNGRFYFCDDPLIPEPSAIDIETHKNEMKRTLPQGVRN